MHSLIRLFSFLTVIGLGLTPAFAHEGVKNPAVKARMILMKEVKTSFGQIGQMAKGAVAFDAQNAQAAKARLLKASQAVVDKFQANETDPLSQAAPAIWKNWDDFVAKSTALEAAIEVLDVSDLATLRGGMRAIGGECMACHKAYKTD